MMESTKDCLRYEPVLATWVIRQVFGKDRQEFRQPVRWTTALKRLLKVYLASPNHSQAAKHNSIAFPDDRSMQSNLFVKVLVEYEIG
jgi:hypothetical protein